MNGRMTDAEVLAVLSQTQIVGLTLFGEARGPSRELRHAIASVIANRVRARQQTPAAVCLASRQFSCWSAAGGAENYHAVMESARWLAAGMVPGQLLGACLVLGSDVVSRTLADSVHGATHYYSPAAMVPKNKVPAWAIGLTPVAVIDGTRFYAGVK
jgi:hypothetical protein